MGLKSTILTFGFLSSIITTILILYLIKMVFQVPVEINNQDFMIMIFIAGLIGVFFSDLLFGMFKSYRPKMIDDFIQKVTEPKDEATKMKIKSGRVYYKLVIERTVSIKENLIDFIRSKTTSGEELNKIYGADFIRSESFSVNLNDVKLDISTKPTEIVLLFHTQMTTDQFNEYTLKWFE